ncbi:MAG: glycosyltransferase family 2 protein [Candidatus Hydrogenedentes bacterium]|nr:glycosyltransferase family 2 protein [Candidatus Hydrogenedentota bacterium]
MSTITVLTLVPNAGGRLARCLESVLWATDIFCVVDPKSSDGSIDVAREYTEHVVVHEYLNAANQRNWALPQIKTEWTLVLDADEWVSPELARRIQEVIQDPDSEDGYEILRHSYFFGKLIRHCGWHRDYNVRLFRTCKGHYLDKRVHSKVVVKGSMGRIREVMYHDTYRTFEEYFATMQRFTTWGAQDAFDAGKRAHLRDLTLRPVLRFLKMYVVRRGFLDGVHGAVLCGLAACSVFAKYAKLWDLERRARLVQPAPSRAPGSER